MKSRYGELPQWLGEIEVKNIEMMFSQYLPIKLVGSNTMAYEPRFRCFRHIINVACNDFIKEFGVERYRDSFVYLTAKNLYQSTTGSSFNRPGWHSDGFLTEDMNYIWSDKFPTIFNCSNFNLTLDDKVSLREMQEQYDSDNNITYPNNSLLKLNQFNIHRVGHISDSGMRAFVKVSISKDKYDLKGNSHNYLLDYDWKMREREQERNIPQLTK